MFKKSRGFRHAHEKEYYLFVFFTSVFTGGYLIYLLGFNLWAFLLNMLCALVGAIIVTREYYLFHKQGVGLKKF